MKKITLWQDTSDEAMVGGEGWGEYDAKASIDKYVNQVVSTVRSAYPEHQVVLYQTANRNRVEVDDERADTLDFEGIRADEEHISDLVVKLWQSWEWLVNA